MNYSYNAIKLLIEETGCDENEAMLALSAAGGDIEKAITDIGFILRHITVFKIKLILAQKNIYGLASIAVNTKTNEILRFSGVFSRDPATYEISYDTDWFSFEKKIFSERLKSGALENFTHDFEENFKLYAEQALTELRSSEADDIKIVVKSFFHPEQAEVKVEAEELNLTQFKKLPDFNIHKNEFTHTGYDLGFIKLEVELMEDDKGKPASHIIEGDTVLSLITDKRDIAHYLAHLLGGAKDGIMTPMPAIIKKIVAKDRDLEVYVHYAHSITGVAKIDSFAKLKVIENAGKPWWKKIVPW